MAKKIKKKTKKKDKIVVKSQLKLNLLHNYDIELNLLWGKNTQTKFKKITQLYEKTLNEDDTEIKDLARFEVAYSFYQNKDIKNAKEIYEYLLILEGPNVAICNNLGLIYYDLGMLEEAIEIYEQGLESDNSNENLKRNLGIANKKLKKNLLSIKTEKQALINLESLNSFEYERLKYFLNYVRTKDDLWISNFEFRFPNWMKKVALNTPEDTAIKIFSNWLKCDFLEKTENQIDPKTGYVNNAYKLNRFLEDEIIDYEDKTKAQQNHFELNIINSISLSLANSSIDGNEYNSLIALVAKIDPKYSNIKSIILRDLNEFYKNYLLCNTKSVVILSGSILETIFLYDCQRNGVVDLVYTTKSNKQMRISLDKAVLNDYLQFYNEIGGKSQIHIHLAQVSRILRNFIHPSVEIRQSDQLDKSKLELCYHSLKEIIANIL